jgi:hypothetical protein
VDHIDSIFSHVSYEVTKKGGIERTGSTMEDAPWYPFRSKSVVEHPTTIETAQHWLKPATIQPFNQEVHNPLQSTEIHVECNIEYLERYR